MLKLLAILLVCLSAQSLNALTVGNCVESPVLNDFDASKYLGLWYEIERSNVVFEADLKCVTATYGSANATTVSVRNYGYNVKTDKPDIALGQAVIPNPAKPNQLLVSFPNNPVPGKYDVWSTDYKYTLIYSCQQIIPALLKFELVWILARERTLDAQTITQLKDLLKSKNVDINRFEKTDQTGC